MKKTAFFVLIALLVLSVVSCKKDDPTIYPEAGRINEAFTNSSFTVTTEGSGDYEYGLKFRVTRNGKITKLGCKMPDAATYRVTLWDASVTPKVVLAQANVTQTATGTLTFTSITPVSLTTGKDYFISLWSPGDWYHYVPVGAPAIPYPIVLGSISITGYQWIETAENPITFPTNEEVDYVAGLADFEFQAD